MMMYNTRAVHAPSRGTGLATVIALHVALVGILVTLKQPVAPLFEKPPLVVTFVPDITAPSEPAPLPFAPDDVSLSEPMPQDTFILPEIAAEAPAETMTAAETIGTSTSPPVRTSDVRKAAGLPGKLEKPPYPRMSETLNEEGISTVEACITPRGTVSSARVVESSGFSRLDAAAVKWIKQVRGFKAATLNGKSISECLTIPIEWKIETR